MVLSTVCKDTHVECKTVGFTVEERVRGNLHKHVFHPAIYHIGKNTMQKYGVGSSKLGRYEFVPVAYAQSAYYSAFFSGAFENAFKHVCCCGLTVSTRNGD